MSNETGHFDEDGDCEAHPRLAEGLTALFESGSSVPAEVDRAVMDRVQRHFVRGSGRRSWSRWAAYAATAAAVIIIALVWNVPEESDSMVSKEAMAQLPADIDRNGRVDILDAFKMARYIESDEPTQKQWDFNSDGQVNGADVDYVALAAVRLGKGV